MKIKQIAINEIREAEYNPRKIAPEALDALVRNIREFGLVDPLILPPGMEIPCLNKHQEFISRLVVTGAAARAGLDIERAWIGRNPRGNMRHYGIIFKNSVVKSNSCDII